MNRHLHSPTRLTEFARNFDEEPETIFTKFVNKITTVYNTSYNSVNDLQIASTSGGNLIASSSQGNLNSDNSPATKISRNNSSNSLNLKLNNDSNSTSSSLNNENIDNNSDKNDQPSPENSGGRTQLNVLKRISNLLAYKNNNLQNYKDTPLQKLWMPDSKAKECYECGQKFTTFRRRKHHCRLCGQIFCSNCCNQVVPGKIINCIENLKVCTYCFKIVLSYSNSPDITVDLKEDLQALQENLSTKLYPEEGELPYNADPNRQSLGNQFNQNQNRIVHRKVSVGYQEERLVSNQPMNISNADRKNILQQSNSLKSLLEEMCNTLPLQNCGTDLIQFLISNQKSSNKIQSIAILSAMLEAGFLIPIVSDPKQVDFDENLHYRLLRMNDILTSSGNMLLDVNYEESSVHMIRSRSQLDQSSDQLSKSMEESVSVISTDEMELENSIRSKNTTATNLMQLYCEHEELILTQILRNFNLDDGWTKILIEHCPRAANQFRSEFITNDLMDIRNYVNFKKVPGGARTDCTLINGVVFTKNIAHKEMASRIENAKILLLQCPIVYERVEGKYISMEALRLQEKQYLYNVTTRILSFKPNVILVHKNVAGIAQDMLRKNGITLVLDVKSTVMERLARCMQCDIVTSIESKFRPAKLGTCDTFYTKNFSDGNGSIKTLMFFEIKKRSARNCCYILRGGNYQELAKLKKVASMLVYARYNWRLEMNFLLDEFATPPQPKPHLFESKEHTPSDNEAADMKEQLLKFNDNISQSRTPDKRVLVEKKSDDKLQIVTSVIENVIDFSDPLRAPSQQDQSTDQINELQIVELAVQTPYDNRFRTALSSTSLSTSPLISFPLPYLETEQGRKCYLRSLFPDELYFSKQWSNNTERNSQSFLTDVENNNFNEDLKLNPSHAFITMNFVKPLDDDEVQTLLAEFRAFGNLYPKCDNMRRICNQLPLHQKPQKLCEDSLYKDVLDLENHQRLPVLFCSFFYNSMGTSSYCAQPTLLDMKFYGQHDIMLAEFLQRYCFKKLDICQSCSLPMMGHVRRYVHSMGCVQVSLMEDCRNSDTNKIYLTSFCTKCKNVTPLVPLSEDAKCLSFAKYLELRFHGHSYRARHVNENKLVEIELTNFKGNTKNCEHVLHRDYIHCFSYKGITAEFAYQAIHAWEVFLPELIINLKKPNAINNIQVLEDIKDFSEKGSEVYSKIQEKIIDITNSEKLNGHLMSLLSDDQIIFRRHVEIVQTLLTEKIINAYDINDAMLNAKRALAESIENWGLRLHDASAQAKANQSQQQQSKSDSNPIDSGTICTEDLKSQDLDPSSVEKIPQTACDKNGGGNTKNLNDQECSDDSFNGIHGATSNANFGAKQETIDEQNNSPTVLRSKETKSDKKTIKKMLSQLLPSLGQVNALPSPLSQNEHLTLSPGVIPILVDDCDLSSIIAYCLTSYNYKKSIEMLNSSNATVGQNNNSNGSPNMKRKSNDGVIDSDEKESPNTKKDDDKKSKSNSHVELSFHDDSIQFSCTIYYAQEFDALRAVAIKPPKLDKTIYKDLEINMKNEEIRLAQKHSSPEIELIRKTSGNNLGLTVKQESTSPLKDILLNQTEIEESRVFLARSLSKSYQWEARGGKSGSKFSKTNDDRFVLKEMSQKEITAFENFAPNYFEYLQNCLKERQPTLLAKIYGVFRIVLKKKDSVQEKLLLVMENLFYDCNIEKKFDLKGSVRDRMVNTTSQNGELVLWDENLIKMSWKNPLYILSHSKTILKEALQRDSWFLERNRVMDYSLLVGLNNNNNTLMLGIIDYIRTFTFDKKVESLIKQSGLLGGQGKLPTVIKPSSYRQRFIEAMDRYFCLVPDRWEGFNKM